MHPPTSNTIKKAFWKNILAFCSKTLTQRNWNKFQKNSIIFLFSSFFIFLYIEIIIKYQKKLHKVTQGFFKISNLIFFVFFFLAWWAHHSKFEEKSLDRYVFFRHSNSETLKDRLTQPTGHPKISACDLANCLDVFFWSPEEFSWLSSTNKRRRKS